MQDRRKDQFPALTGLRFIAAMSVVIGHAVPRLFPINGSMPDWYYYLMVMPALGMPLFFTLSGFVIFYNYSNILDEKPITGLRRFFVARFSRLYPLYLLVLLVSLGNLWGYEQLPSATAEFLPYYLTLTQTWFYAVAGRVNSVYIFGDMPTIAWSISTEWFFYLAFPVILLGVKRIKHVRWLVIFGIVAFGIWASAIAIVLTNLSQIDSWAVQQWGVVAGFAYHAKIPGQSFVYWLVYLSPYAQITCFVLGCLIAAGVMKRAGDEKSAGNMQTVAACVVVAAALFVPYAIASGRVFSVFNFTSLALIIPVVLLIICCTRYNNWIIRGLSSGPMVRFGEASYALYLLHMPLVMAWRHEAAAISAWEVGVADLARAIPFVFFLLGASLVSYEYFEMPAQRFLRRALMPKPRPAD